MHPIDHARAIDAVYAAGHWLLQNDRPRDAVDVFRTILLAAPADDRGWLGLAEAHLALGETAKALELLRLASEATGRRARVMLGLARCLRHSGGDAADYYDLALELASAEDSDDLVATIRNEQVQPCPTP